MPNVEVTEQEALLIRLLRMRTDVGHMTMGRILTGSYQASFKVFGGEHYHVSVRLDPVLALIDVLGPRKGQTVEDVERFAIAQTPKFDLANMSPKVVEMESERAAQEGRKPPQLVNDVIAAHRSRDFVGDVKPRKLVDPAEIGIEEPKPKRRPSMDDDLL